MHRHARLFFLVFAACGGGSALRPQPLPELVTVEVAKHAIPIDRMMLEPGERMVWDVSWRGISVGRAELVVGVRDAYSKFATRALVESVMKVEHELTTVLDRPNARATSVSEMISIDGAVERADVAFEDEVAVQTIHSTLGWLRAWADPSAIGGKLQIHLAGKLHVLEVAQPQREDLQGSSTIKIECRTDALAITIWLGDDDARAPRRIEIVDDGAKVVAELIEFVRE